MVDLVTGFNSTPRRLKNEFQFSKTPTNAIYTIFWTSLPTSDFTIFFMSMKRYIAIVFPFKAQFWLSKARTHQELFRNVVHRRPVLRVQASSSSKRSPRFVSRLSSKSQLSSQCSSITRSPTSWDSGGRSWCPCSRPAPRVRATTRTVSRITSWWRSWSRPRSYWSSLFCRTWSLGTFYTCDVCSRRPTTTRDYNFSLITTGQFNSRILCSTRSSTHGACPTIV